jgi:LmbE family N-acetylglucosaminyl deacetylase
VLAIGAHPDDVELQAGATLAKWAARGARVELLVLTDGSKGTWDDATTPGRLAARRAAEQKAAGEALGVAHVHFLDAVDGELEASRPHLASVCGTIRAARPDVVVGHDPWKHYRLHPDHRAAGTLTVDGIVAARDRLFFPDDGEPHRPAHLLLFEAQEPDHVEAVDEQDVTRKLASLAEHRSQWRSTMGIDVDSPDAEHQFRAFEARVRGEIAHGGGEIFKRLDDL